LRLFFLSFFDSPRGRIFEDDLSFRRLLCPAISRFLSPLPRFDFRRSLSPPLDDFPERDPWNFRLSHPGFSPESSFNRPLPPIAFLSRRFKNARALFPVLPLLPIFPYSTGCRHVPSPTHLNDPLASTRALVPSRLFPDFTFFRVFFKACILVEFLSPFPSSFLFYVSSQLP